MMEYRIVPGESVRLDEDAELVITGIIAGIVSGLPDTTEQGAAAPCAQTAPRSMCRVYAYNICKNHVHMLIECENKRLPEIVRLIKGKSSQLYKEHPGIQSQHKFHLWAQKYNRRVIQSDNQFNNTVRYIINNRIKHGLPENRGLQPLVLWMIGSCGSESHIEFYRAQMTGVDTALTGKEIRIVEGV